MKTHNDQVNIVLTTPRFILRVGGVAVNVLESLRFTQSAQWHNDVLALEKQLLQEKDSLVDSLHEAVNRHKEDKKARRDLINKKRDIFNMHIGNTAAIRTIDSLLTEGEKGQLYAWLDLWEAYQRQLQLGCTIFSSEIRQKRQNLKGIVANDDFRKGILLSSADLHQAIDDYIAAENDHPNREARTVERSLLEYLFRAAYKTSPFSTFTSVCIGELEPEAKFTAAGLDMQLQSLTRQSFTRLNMLILSRLSSQILTAPDLRQRLAVRVTNGFYVRNDHVEYIRRKPLHESSDTVDFIQEHIIRLPVRAPLRYLLDFMGDGHEEKLEDVIAYMLSCNQRQRDVGTIVNYLDHLLRLGFLIVPALQIDIHHPYPLEDYCMRLRAICTRQTDEIAVYLDMIAALVATYAQSAFAQRDAYLTEIRQLLQRCGDVLHQDPVFSKTLLYEDTVLTPSSLKIYQKSWDTIFADLQEFQRVLPLFDTMLPQKILLRGYFQARYGAGQRCEDIFSFADHFTVEFQRTRLKNGIQTPVFDIDGSFHGRTNYFQQQEIDALNDGLVAVADAVREAYRSLPAGSDELVLDDTFLQKVTPYVPSNYTNIFSHAFFSQLTSVNDQPMLILNQVYSGLTLLFSRFAYCFSHDRHNALVDSLRDLLEQIQDETDTVFAELKGGYDATNLNLHPAVTAYELVCPGELSTRPLCEQVPLEDLFIQDDTNASRLRLFSRRLGKEIVPLYLGFLTPAVIPEIQQVLLSFSYLAISPLNFWSGTSVGNKDEQVRFFPRLYYKHIILQRATWQVRAEAIPVRTNGQSDADYYLSITRWRKQLGLPTKVFFTALSSVNDEQKDRGENEERAMPVYKPFYVDFENFFSISLLESSMRKSNTAFSIAEMLPGTKQLWFEHNNQKYVSEFIFELSQTRRD